MIRFRLALALLASAGLSSMAGEALAAEAADAADGATVDTVVVTAPRLEVKARETQFKAPNLINVQSAETIAKYPDFNAAEALGRIPGVTLSSDTGEGRFVEIRGIDGNLNGATYGGVVLLNTNPGGTIFGTGRAVEFDTVPIGAIDGIIVTKTGTPDHEAEGLGGSVELTPRTAANITRPFAEATLGWGYEFDHDHAGPLNADLAVGTRFGFGDKGLVVQGEGDEPAPRAGWMSNPTPFSVVLTGSWRSDRRGFDDLEEDYIDDPSLGPEFNKAFADLQLRRYDYHRRRFGYGGEFDFQPNDDHHYYARAAIAGYTESVIKNRLTYDSLDGSPSLDPANPNGFLAAADLSIKGTDEQETHRNQVYAAGGQDQFGEIIVDYRAAYSRATFNVSRNFGTRFDGPSGVPVRYDNITDPNFPTIQILDGTDPNNAAAYTLSGLSNSTEHDQDHEWSYAFNASAPLHLFGADDRLKVGVEARLRNKTQAPFQEDFSIPTVLLSDLSSHANTDFYASHYSNGPQIDPAAVQALIASGQAVGSGLVQDLTGSFTADENIYAGYGMYTANAGKWTVMGGVRVERTDATYGSYSFDENGNLLGFDAHQVDYTNAFPTVQLRYAFTPSFLVRATFSTGIGRPGFSQVAAATTIDFSDEIITTGNPNLKPTTGDNYDLSLEYYLPHGGIVQLGAFDKQFANYVVARTRTGTDPRLPGATNVQFITYENAPGYARGLEAAYHQQFLWLPHPFHGLGVEANATLVDSRIELRPGDNESLPATSRLTYNLAALYEAYGVTLRLAGEYVSHSLFGIGDSPDLDVIQDNRFTLDFTSSYQLNPNWAVYFNAKNLTNTPLRYYEGSPNRPIQREFYDLTLEAGVKARF